MAIGVHGRWWSHDRRPAASGWSPGDQPDAQSATTWWCAVVAQGGQCPPYR